MESSAAPQRRALWIALAVALPIYLALAWRFDFVCDDAYISFRYAKHWAAGEGLTFNLGQVPPVEGYSNFLWVVWAALCEKTGLDPALGARLLSVLCGGLLLTRVLASAARRLAPSAGALVATGIFLASLPSFGLWATSGLETMATALCLFVGWDWLGDEHTPARPLAAGLAFAAAALLRADGALLALELIGLTGIAWWIRGDLREHVRPLALAAALLVVTVTVHVVWRHSYYGEWLPNTAKVKAGFSTFRLDRGWRYLVSYFLSMPALLLLLPCLLRPARRGQTTLLVGALGFAAAQAAYSVYIGGDFMPFGRFLLPALPFLALLHAQWSAPDPAPGAFGQLARGLVWMAAPLLSVAAAFDYVPFPRAWLERYHFRFDRPFMTEVERWRDMNRNEERWKLLGRALASHTELGESMILGGIGAIGYYTELFVYDTYGLVSPEVVERGRILSGSSPGHDMRVASDFFFPPPHGEFHDKPTYLGATLVRIDTGPGHEEAPWWEEGLGGFESHKWRQLVRIEPYPLPHSQGFPENSQLLLLRFLWSIQ